MGKEKRYALFHEIWGWCVHVEYPAQWLLNCDHTQAQHFPSRKAARQASSKWDHHGHIHVLRVR